jgi:CRP-like cAMP-binding protein
MAQDNMLLASLDEDERDRLSPFLESVQLGFAETLIEPERPIEHVWFPCDAVSSTLQVLQGGETVESGLMGLEGLVGVQLWLRQSTTPARVVIQIPGTGYRMSRANFVREVMDVPASPLNGIIARYIHGFLVLTSQTAACNRVHQVDQRLCRWLRMVYNRVPGRSELPLRQEFLAAMLGVQRPTVSTAASILQRAGFIDYSRGKMTILDPEGLARGACECYPLMEAQFDRIFTEPWRPN